MLTEKTTYHLHQTEDDHIEVKPIIRVYRHEPDQNPEDGELIGSQMAGVRKVIAPGRDYSKEAGKVRRACAAAHVPTVVNKFESGLAYEAAVTTAAQTKYDEAVAEQVKTDTYQIHILAKAAHDEAVLAGSKDTEALGLIKIEAITKHTAAIKAHKEAVSAATEAKDTVPLALATRTAARQAYDDFENS